MLSKLAVKPCEMTSVRPTLVGTRKKEFTAMAHKAAASLVLALLMTCSVLAARDRDREEPSTQAPPQKIDDLEAEVDGGLYLDGRVYISGQPTEAAFAELGGRGLTVVVNTRTPEEVEDRENVPFDEERIVRELGMSYISIPLGGEDHPYEPAAVEQLAEVLSLNDGPVLIHCYYGGRAAYLWLAYLVQNEGLPLERAMARGEAMVLKPHPVGRLLGRPTKLVFAQ
jgi:uncharacterized protein (TIGR01244 family)